MVSSCHSSPPCHHCVHMFVNIFSLQAPLRLHYVGVLAVPDFISFHHHTLWQGAGSVVQFLTGTCCKLGFVLLLCANLSNLKLYVIFYQYYYRLACVHNVLIIFYAIYMCFKINLGD